MLVDLFRNDDTDEPETRKKKKKKKRMRLSQASRKFVILGRKHAILLHIPLVNHKYFVGTIMSFVGLYGRN